MAQGGNGFQCHVTASLNRPFIVLFEKDCAHEAEDGGFIGKDPHHIRSPLNLSIETFDQIGGVDLCPVVFWGRWCRQGKCLPHPWSRTARLMGSDGGILIVCTPAGVTDFFANFYQPPIITVRHTAIVTGTTNKQL